MNKIDRIYVLHYSPLKERKEYLEKQFFQYKITNYEFFTDYSDRNDAKKDIIDKYFKLDNLSPAQICIAISHIELYKKIIANNENMCLILEDDAIFCYDFVNNFNKYINCIPSDIDIAFINDGCNLHSANRTSDTIWYPATYSRTTCSYLITKQACSKLLQTIIPFENPIDHELNKQIVLHNLKCYWCEPTLITDGSTTVYNSSH